MIERHAARKEIAAGLKGLERELIFARQPFERLRFDESDLAIRSVLGGKRSFFEKVTIADKAAADHCLDAGHALQFGAFPLGQVDADQFAVKHCRYSSPDVFAPQPLTQFYGNTLANAAVVALSYQRATKGGQRH